MSVLKPESCLESCLAGTIRHFIRLRQLSGTDYHTQALLLLYFDRFLVAQKVTGSRLTRQIIEAYEKTLSHLMPRVRGNRMCVVRQLWLIRHKSWFPNRSQNSGPASLR